MSKVALIYPYFRTHSASELLFPPLGAACLSSQLQKIGIETKIFDCTFSTLKQIETSLTAFKPDVVGIYSMITLNRNTFRVAERVRAIFPDCLLVSGGPLPTLYPEKYSNQFDAVFQGEVDLSFPRFCQDVFQKNISRHQLRELPLESYEGLFIKKDHLQINNAPVNYPEKVIQSFPIPFRGDFNHTEYQKVWSEKFGSKTASIMTTLGCPFSCDFCSKPVYGNLFRRRNLDVLFEEIKEIQQLGYDSLWIADDNLTLDLNHLKEFCLRIAPLNIKWSCLSRVTGINEQVTKLMKDAGCKRVYLGLESGSKSTLKMMKKQATIEDGINTVHLFHRTKIETAAFFIVGYPGETISSIEDTFQFALTLPLDEISFNVPFPLPGSRLFDCVSDIDRDQDWNTENEITFVYKSEFDPQWLRRRIRQTRKAFLEKINH
jgi:anaerobic magnesium-protoporphyrin IX monomethyl ester cyclase